VNGVLRLPKLASSQEASHPRGFQSQTPETKVQVSSIAEAETPLLRQKREKKPKKPEKRERVKKHSGKEE